MLKIFHSNRPTGLILIPILILMYFALNAFFQYHLIDREMNLGLWGKYPTSTINTFLVALPLLFVGVGAILLNRMFNNNEFTEKNNYLPSLFYVLFLSLSHSFYFLDGLSIAQLFIILSLIQLFRLNQKEDGRRTVFNAGFFFGIASTFLPILFFGFPFLLFMIWISRPFLVRESAIALAGVFIPLFYAATYSLFFNIPLDLTVMNTSSNEVFPIDTLVFVISLMLFFVFGLKTFSHKIQIGSIRIKKIFRLLFFLASLFFLLFLVDVIFYRRVQTVILIIIPMVMILPYSFGERKLKLIPRILFYLFFLFTVSKFFIPFNA